MLGRGEGVRVSGIGVLGVAVGLPGVSVRIMLVLVGKLRVGAG